MPDQGARKTELTLSLDTSSDDDDLILNAPREARELLMAGGYDKEARELLSDVARYLRRRSGSGILDWQDVSDIIDRYVEILPTEVDTPSDYQFPPAFRADGDYSFLRHPGFRPWTDLKFDARLAKSPSKYGIVIAVYELLASQGHAPLGHHFIREMQKMFEARKDSDPFLEFREMAHIIDQFVWFTRKPAQVDHVPAYGR